MVDHFTTPTQRPFVRDAGDKSLLDDNERFKGIESLNAESNGLSLTTETITPRIAESYLEQNVLNNRPVSQRHVEALARDMRADRWTQNGETIKFSPPTTEFPTGELMDGQQRLWACITANRPFTTAVVRGVESLDDVDRSRPRTLGHALGMRGYTRATKLSVVLNTIWRWEHTNWRAAHVRPTTREGMEFLDPNYDLIYDSLRYGLKISGIEGSLENASLAFWRLAKTCGRDVATKIFTRIARADWDSLNDPLFRYFEIASRAKASARKPHKLVKFNWLIRAIDASLNGEEHASYHFLRWDISKQLRMITGESAEPKALSGSRN